MDAVMLMNAILEARKNNDFVLASTLESIRQITAKRHNMPMEFRVSAELTKRANSSATLMHDDWKLNRIISNDKLALEADINRRKIAAKRGLYWSATLQKFVSVPKN